MNQHSRDAAGRAASVAGLRVHLVQDPDRAREIFALRYRAYRVEGVISANPTGLFMDRYDLLKTSLLFAVSDATGAIVGSLRFAVQPPASSALTDFQSTPEFAIFPDALEVLTGSDRMLASGARLCIDPDHPNRSEIAMMLMCAVLIAGDAVGAKWAIATARGNHIRFYRRLLGMEPICPPRRMPGLMRDYALLAGDIDLRFREVAAAFPEAVRNHFDRVAPHWSHEVTTALSDVMAMCCGRADEMVPA